MTDKTHSLQSDYLKKTNARVAAEHGWDAVYGVQFGHISIPVSYEMGEPIYTSEGKMTNVVGSKYVTSLQVKDPDTDQLVEMEIRKLDTGAMIGFDGSYLEQLGDNEHPFSPYDEDTIIVVPDDENNKSVGFPIISPAEEECQACSTRTSQVFILTSGRRVCRKCMEEQGP